MLKNLTYHIVFSSTKKAFSQSIEFKPGLTVISGANERGKSLIIEMIEYALFGASALRGILADYDTLDVDLSFTIKGQDYKVVRKGNKTTLNGTLAVGTAAVNREIVKKLGFGLDVWRIGCSSKQGELDKLTVGMQPTDRRRMVDKVIGLNQMEDLEKEYRSEGNAYKRASELIKNKLIEPTAIEVPEDYEPSEQLEILYNEQVEVEAERRQLEKLVEPEPPIEPIRPTYSEDVVEHEHKRLKIERERSGIERELERLPSVVLTGRDINRALEYYEQQKRGPRPSYSRDDLRVWEQNWHQIGMAESLVVCPSCGTNFDPKDSTTHTLPEEPPISLAVVETELSRLARWDDFSGELIEFCDISEAEAKEQANALAHQTYRNELLDRLSGLPNLEDRSNEKQQREEYLAAYRVFEGRREDYNFARTRYNEGIERLSQLPEPDQGLVQRLKNSRTYEEQKRRYDADVEAYNEAVKAVEEELAKAEDRFKASEALKDARSEIKQHLIPSLNRVASHLLSEMTDGERSKIVVDEDFEVVVDGQHVRTLSGSGISVVNLALRIALGQVLTQSVVPLFLADEIDKDMDADRAASTHKSLRKLTKILDKVIIVTHKQIDGDNLIAL